MIIAFWLEAWLTKQEILSRYLSSVYFGDGVYGLRAAAHHYFHRDPEKLIAGPVGDARRDGAGAVAARADAASRRRPEAQPAGAPGDGRHRRDQRRRAPRAMASARPVAQEAKLPAGTYFADWVAPSAAQAFESDFGQVKVRTTLDRDLQRLAVRAVDRARESAMPRRRWSRCGPTGASSRWSAARITRNRRSTA